MNHESILFQQTSQQKAENESIHGSSELERLSTSGCIFHLKVTITVVVAEGVQVGTGRDGVADASPAVPEPRRRDDVRPRPEARRAEGGRRKGS